MKQISIFKKNIKAEWLFYICITVFNIYIGVQLFQLEFLPLCDWVPHIYNSGIIHELLFHSESSMHDYYMLDYSFFTNLTDHFLLAGIRTFTGGAIASQIVVLIVFIIMQAGFYLFLKTLKINQWWTFLIVPFLINGSFINGMMNFNIGIGLLFFLLSLWLKYYKKPSVPLLLMLILLPSLLYITHIFVYGVSTMAVGVFICMSIVFQLRKRKSLLFSLKSLALFIISNTLPGLLFLNYFFTKTHVSSSITFDTIRLSQLMDFFNLQFLVGYNSKHEGLALTIIMITFGVLLLLSAISWLVPALRKHNIANKSDEYVQLYSVSNIVVIIVLIIALLLVPGKVVGAGNFIDMRIQMLLCIFCLIFIASMVSKAKYERLFLLAIIPALIGANIHKDYLLDYWQTKGYPVAVYMKNLSNSWDDYSSVMVIKGDIPWYMLHYGNALGIENNVICYENYETYSGHFCVNRVEGSPLTDINHKAMFFRPAQVPWDIILPDDTPDYIVLLSMKERIELPDEVQQLYIFESEQQVGFFHLEVMRKD